MLGPKTFIAYVDEMHDIFEAHGLHHHAFADDTQTYTSVPRSQSATVAPQLQNCIAEVVDWCGARGLQLNAGKTDLLWYGSSTALQSLSSSEKDVVVGDATIVSADAAIRDLGVQFDCELSMSAHIAKTTQTCFFHIRRLRQIRRLLGRDVAAKLVSAFVISRLDYCNAVLAGLPESTIAPLQRVLNSAARLVLGLRPRDHVTAALIDLHWLPVAARIEFKLCTLVYQSVTGNAPTYIDDMLQPVSGLDRQTILRSASKGDLVVPRTRLKFGERAFRVAAPRLWNELPSDIKKASTLATFKKHLKTFLFCKHYGTILEQ